MTSKNEDYKQCFEDLVNVYKNNVKDMQEPIRVLEEEILWFRRYDKYVYQSAVNKLRIKAMRKVIKELKRVDHERN